VIWLKLIKKLEIWKEEVIILYL